MTAQEDAQAGEGSVKVFDKTVSFQVTVNSLPALGFASQLTVGQALVAGGTGSLTVTVENSGGQDSTPTDLTLTLPDGITRTGAAPADTVTCGVGSDCTLGPIGAGQSVELTFEVAVGQEVAERPLVQPTVFLNGASTSTPTPVTVASGVAALTGAPAGPLTAGSTAVLTVTRVPAATVAEPGPVSFTSTGGAVEFGESAGCEAAGENAVSCDRDEFTLSVRIADPAFSGTLPIEVTDAGRRVLELIDAASQTPFQVVAASEANLVLTDLRISEPLLAGETGQLSVVVSNTGGRAATQQPVVVTLPENITATGIRYGEQQLCSAPEAVAAGASTALDSVLSCTIPAIPPTGPGGPARTLVVDLDVPATTTQAPLPNATISIGVNGPTADIGLTVATGIDTLSAFPAGPITAGVPTTLTITSTVVDGVQNRGDITFTATEPVRFRPTARCPADETGRRVVCSGNPFTLDLTVTDNTFSGALPIVVTDAGGRTLDDLKLEAQPRPAGVLLTSLRVGTPLIAGGSGTLALTVTNTGGTASSTTDLTLELPEGIRRTDALPAAAITCGEGSACVLQPIPPNSSVELTFALAVDPDAGRLDPTNPTPPAATVTVPGLPEVSVELPVLTGIASLVASPSGPLTAGTATTLSVSSTVELGVRERGDITFTTTSDEVRFNSTESCSVTEDGRSALCRNNPFDIAISLAGSIGAGPLPIDVLDAGGRELDLPLDAVGSAPQLVFSVPDLVRVPVAGGSAAFSLTVTNAGGQPSAPTTIDLDIPVGFTLASITVSGGVTCLPDPPVNARAVATNCTLPPVGPVGSQDPNALTARVLGFALTVDPTVAAAEPPLTGTVTIGGVTSEPITLIPTTGIQSLRAATDSPLPAGSTTSLRVTSTPKPGVTDPGPITFTATGRGITFQDTQGCLGVPKQGEFDRVRCDGEAFELRVAVASDQASGPLPVLAADAGGRTLDLTGPAPEFRSVQVIAATAQLQLGELAGTLIAGGTGSFELTVTNTGSRASVPEQITATLPTGFDVTGVLVDQEQICKGAGDTCLIPVIEPRATIIVRFQVDVAPDAAPGTATVKLPNAVPAPEALKVDLTPIAGITQLTVQANEPLVADNSTQPVTVTATFADNSVTNPGPITFSTGTDSVTLTCPPGEGPGSSTVTCGLEGNSVAMGVYIAADQPTGPLPLQAKDAARRQITVDATAATIYPPARLQPTQPEVSQQLTAGGTGQFTVRVTNEGGLRSAGGESIDLVLPVGFSRTGTIIPGGSCAGTGPVVPTLTAAAVPDCTLPPINAGDSLELTFTIAVAPTVGASAAGTIAIDRGPTTPLNFAVRSAYGALQVTSGKQVVADGTSQLVIFDTGLASGVTDPGPMTFTSSDPDVKLTCGESGPVPTDACQITETNSISLLVTVSRQRQPGDLVLTATDAGRRPQTVTLEVLGAPRLEVSELAVPTKPVAGTSVAFTLTVTNVGGSPSSGAEIVDARLPAGFVVTRVDAGGSAICTTTGKDCRLPVLKAGATTTLTITASIPITTKPGDYPVVVSVDSQPSTGVVTVLPGVRTPLELSALEIVQRRLENRPAILTLTVTNTSPLPAPSLPIDIAPQLNLVWIVNPAGVTIGYCYPGSPLCQLPELAPGTNVTLTIVVSVPPNGTVTVTIDGVSSTAPMGSPPTVTSLGPTSSGSATETPNPGATPSIGSTPPSTEQTSPTIPPTEGTSSSIPPTDEMSSTTPSTEQTSPITPPTEQTSPTTDDTDPVEPSTEASDPETTDDPTSTVTTSDQGPESPVETSPDAEPVFSTPNSTEEPGAARLSISGEVITQTLPGGGKGTITFTVTNKGDAKSDQQPVIIKLPNGVSTTRVTVNGTAVTEGAVQTCTLPELNQGDSVKVVIDIEAAVDTMGGPAVIAVGGSSVEGQLTIDLPGLPVTPDDVLPPVVRNDDSAPGN